MVLAANLQDGDLLVYRSQDLEQENLPIERENLEQNQQMDQFRPV